MEILNQFGVNPLLLAAQVVNFLILLFILNKLLYKPILKLLWERRKRIEESLRHAEEIEKKLKEAQVESDKILLKASDEGEKIIKEAQQQAVGIIDDTKERAQLLSEKTLKEARSQIEIERENMRVELQKDLAKLVMMVVKKVAGKMFNQKSQRLLIEKVVKEFRS